MEQRVRIAHVIGKVKEILEIIVVMKPEDAQWLLSMSAQGTSLLTITKRFVADHGVNKDCRIQAEDILGWWYSPVRRLSKQFEQYTVNDLHEIANLCQSIAARKRREDDLLETQ